MPYPYFIVYDFEALLENIKDGQRGTGLNLSQKHVPASVAVSDNLTNDPTYFTHPNPKILIKLFVDDL